MPFLARYNTGRQRRGKSFLGCSKKSWDSRIRNKKLKKRNKKINAPHILCLPQELVTDILVRVASSSATDLFNAKLSCRKICELANDNYIYRLVSLENCQPVPWHHVERSFFDRCVDSGNPEALFRQGVIDYFCHANPKLGLSKLRRAASTQHYAASYILSVILLCSNDKTKQEEGMQLMKNIKREKRIKESRKKLQDVLCNIWVHAYLQRRSNTCPGRDKHLMMRMRGWESPNVDEEVISCHECSCNREIVYVCNHLLRDHQA